MKVSGLVIGSRKAGTTWLYSNFLKDPDTSVAAAVKESRFFLGSMDEEAYHRLYEKRAPYYLEVDTALCYSNEAPGRISRYNPAMNLVLIFRDPTAYAVSRYVHGVRKGEIQHMDIATAIRDHEIMRTELDYAAMIDRFAFAGERLKVMRFEDLSADPTSFYRTVKGHLTGTPADTGPFIFERANTARTSRAPFVAKLLSDAAKLARRYQLHHLVNAAKGVGVHTMLERSASSDELGDLTRAAADAVERHHPDALRVYRSL
jgi:hypothetical protein